MFAQFEEWVLLSETRNVSSKIRDNTESSDKYDDNSTLPSFISEEEMDVMSPGD